MATVHDPGAAMDADTFAALWDHEVADNDRSWRPDCTTYRNAFLYLLGERRPHVARLAVPNWMQPILVALFLDGHQMWVQPARSGERIYLTIWRPPLPGEAADGSR